MKAKTVRRKEVHKKAIGAAPQKMPRQGRHQHLSPSAPQNGKAPGDQELDAVLVEVTAESTEKPLEEWATIECPYCGENFEIHVTSEQDGETVVEDCHVCCRPIELLVQVEDGEIQVESSRS